MPRQSRGTPSNPPPTTRAATRARRSQQLQEQQQQQRRTARVDPYPVPRAAAAARRSAHPSPPLLPPPPPPPPPQQQPTLPSVMERPAPSRLFSILNAFDPNDELPDEFLGRLEGRIDPELDEVANLRGGYYSSFATIVLQAAEHDATLRSRLEGAVPDLFCRLDLARRQAARDLRQHSRFLLGSGSRDDDGPWLEDRLRAHVTSVSATAASSDARGDMATATLSAGLVLRALRATAELHSNACTEHEELLSDMATHLAGFPEDVLEVHLDAVRDTTRALWGRGEAGARLARRLEDAVRFLMAQRRRGGRSRHSTTGPESSSRERRESTQQQRVPSHEEEVVMASRESDDEEQGESWQQQVQSDDGEAGESIAMAEAAAAAAAARGAGSSRRGQQQQRRGRRGVR